MRVVVLGPGGAGKSTFARRLADRAGAEWIEIDKLFWQPGLSPLPISEWERRQVEIFRGERWIADGDLGPYDSLNPRLQRADAVVLLDLPRWTCAWRTLKRSPEGLAYWKWLLTWHRRYRPRLLAAIAAHPHAQLLVVRSAPDYERALNMLGRSG